MRKILCLAAAFILAATWAEPSLANRSVSLSKNVYQVPSATTDSQSEDAIVVPFSEDFEVLSSLNPWWFVNSYENRWCFGTAENNTTDQFGNLLPNGRALYISSDDGASATYNMGQAAMSYACVRVNFPQAQAFGLSFDWKCMGEGSYDALSVYLVSADTQIDTTTSGAPSGYPVLGNLSGSYSFQRASAILSGSEYFGEYILVFAWHNDSYGGSPLSAVVDNLSIVAYNCAAVTNLAVTSMEESGLAKAVLSFQDNTNTSASYIAEYRLHGSSDQWNRISATSSPVEISNLQFGSRYDVRVRAFCSESDSSLLSEELTFRTVCGTMSLPWTVSTSAMEIEQNPAVGNQPAPVCWYNIKGEQSGYTGFSYRSYYQDLYYSGSNGPSTNHPSNYLITPLLNLSGNDRLNFSIKADNPSFLPVLEVFAFDANAGDISSAADTTDFALIDRIVMHNYVNEFVPYELSLSQYQGATRLAFAVRENSGYFILNNISVSAMPDCPEVYDLNVVSNSSTSMAVSFSTSNGTPNGWVVAYSPVDEGESFNPATAIHINVAATDNIPVIINNLQEGQRYCVSVKHNCSTASYCPADTIVLETIGTLPYSEDFDNAANATEWTRIITDLTENRWYVGTATNNTTTTSGELTNGGALYISKDEGATNEYNNTALTTAIAYTHLAFGEGNSFVLSFDWKAMGEGNYDCLKAYLMPVGSDLTLNDVYAVTSSLSGSSTWQTETVSLPSDYANSIWRLMFVWKNDFRDGENPPAAVDNVNLRAVACSTIENVNLAFAEAEEGATLTVTVEDNNTNVSYVLEYKEQSEANFTTITDVQFPYTFAVDYTTTYIVRAAPVCNDGTQLAFTSTQITTPCQSLLPDWIETFDANPLSSQCWQQKMGTLPSSGSVNTSDLSSGYYWSYNTDRALNGVVSGKMAINVCDTRNGWLITPSVNLGDGSTIYQLAADIALTPYYGSGNPGASPNDMFAILVSTDNGMSWNRANALIYKDNDTDTEHDYSSFGTVPQRVIYKLVDNANNPYTGVVKFAFHAQAANGGDNILFVDNIALTQWSECSAPYNFSTSDMSSQTATISFQSAETATNFEYVLTVGATAQTEGQTPTALTSHSVALTSLSPSTTYTISIRTICSETLSSPWANHTFTTYPAVASLPYTASFSSQDEASQWVSLSSGANKWTVGHATTSDLNSELSGENDMAAYISDNGQSYHAASMPTYAYFFKDFDFGDGFTSYNMSFDYKASGAINSWSGDTLSGIRLYIQDPAEPLNLLAVPSNTSDLMGTYAGVSEWTNHAFELPAMSGTKRVIFFAWGYDQYGSTSIPAAIDNIMIWEQYCQRPTLLTQTNSTSSTATISWQGFSDSYVITCTPANDDEETQTLTTQNDFITIMGLQPASAYTITIKGLCGGDESLLSDPLVVSTSCFDGVVSAFPYEEGFESGIDCWSQTSQDPSLTWQSKNEHYYSYNSYIYPATDGGSRFAYVVPSGYNRDTVYLITPELDLTTLNMPRLSFLHIQKQSYGLDKLKVCYRTSSEGEWIDLVNFNNAIETWVEDSIDLPNPSSHYQIAFVAQGDLAYGVGLDNVRVYEANTSIAPCEAPEAVVVSSLTSNTATISWNGTATSYQVRLEDQDAETTTATNKTFTDLAPETFYIAFVRAVCEGNNSEWISVTFTTPGAYVAPVVTTLAATEVTHNQAILNATITPGSEPVSTQGFEYKKSTEEDWETALATDGTISLAVTDLEAETEYQFKAFATTASCTVYGETLSFTTTAAPVIVPPAVTTLEATAVTHEQATLNATVTAGSEPITSQGFRSRQQGSQEWIEFLSSGETMSATLEGLTAANTYEYKAFATTESGTVEGEVMTFTTTASIVSIDAEATTLTLYPNPASEKVTIALSRAENGAKIAVSDMQGRIILSDNMTSDTYELSVENLASGVYYIRVINGNTIHTQKLIVK
ncbi:MAG: fibronectin type III domain-containing protein [Candidatus Onthomorpha sp.]